ncbi:zinc-binding dehydrogenase [Photobacterium sp. DNB22_13_2]
MGEDIQQSSWSLLKPEGIMVSVVESEQLRPFIEHRFPLEKIAEIHQQSQSDRTRGKIAIDVS